jgi:hypothetical protein
MKSHHWERYSLGALALIIVAAMVGPPSGGDEVLAAPSKDVFVVNDPGHPVPVTPPALEPVQKSAFGTFPAGNHFSDTIDLYTVPAGKRLVIQTVSIASNLTGRDQHLMHVLLSASSDDVVAFTVNVQPVAEGFFSSTGANIFRKTDQVTAYADAGTVVSAVGTRDGTNINFLDSLGVGIAGYLVDAP